MIFKMYYNGFVSRSQSIIKLPSSYTSPHNNNEEIGVRVQNASFNWGIKQKVNENSINQSARSKVPTETTEFLHKSDLLHWELKNTNFTAEAGQLICLVGEVGTGKTSFLLSIAGETEITFGTRAIGGKVAYVEQEPFILSDTVRANILFGNKYDEARLRQSLEAS